MQRKRFVWSGALLGALVLIAGCPTSIFEVWIEADRPLAINQGEVITFRLVASSDYQDVEWVVSDEMPVRDNRSATFHRTFPHSGEFAVEVRVTGLYGQFATSAVRVKVNPVSIPVTPDPPIPPDPPDVSVDINSLIITGGKLIAGGKIEAVDGDELDVNLVDAISGGKAPFHIIWKDRHGGEIGRGMRLVWIPSRTGESRITLEIIDARGRLTRLTIVIVVVPKPPPPPAPTVDLKINGSNGPLEMEAEESGEKIVLATWTSQHAQSVSVLGAPGWQGARALQNSVGEEVTLEVGTWVLKVTATGSDSQTATDTVKVTVKPFVPPDPGHVVLTITAPVNRQTFAVNEAVTFSVSIVGGVGPFVVHWGFYDGENIYRTTFGRVLSLTKELQFKTDPRPDRWASNVVRVSDSEGRASAPVRIEFRVE